MWLGSTLCFAHIRICEHKYYTDFTRLLWLLASTIFKYIIKIKKNHSEHTSWQKTTQYKFSPRIGPQLALNFITRKGKCSFWLHSNFCIHSFYVVIYITKMNVTSNVNGMLHTTSNDIHAHKTWHHVVVFTHSKYGECMWFCHPWAFLKMFHDIQLVYCKPKPKKK